MVGPSVSLGLKATIDPRSRAGLPRTSMYVRTEVVDGCAVSRLVRLAEGESPPKWDGEAPARWEGGPGFGAEIGAGPPSNEQDEASMC